MSAVVMVADAWKPSVVQIVPFANRTIQRHSSFNEANSSSKRSKKCFPVLAVTRNKSELSVKDSIITVDTYESLTLSDYRSEISDSGRTSTSSFRPDRVYRKSARHSSLRENRSEMMVKFAVQDLNEQSDPIPRRSSISSNDTGIALSTVSANTSIASNGLPKPTLTDKKFLYKQNGFKKSSSTPGEIELQKQKEEYAREQAQKRKRYKLNVNQLPRSNTPIHDHDPDKLNMKQVIRFLQKQKPGVSPRQEMLVSRSPGRQNVETTPKSASYELAVGNKVRSDLKTSQSVRSRKNEINIARRSKLVSRDSDGSSRCSSTHTIHFHSSPYNDHINKSDNSYISEKRYATKQEKENMFSQDSEKESQKSSELNDNVSQEKINRLGRDYNKERDRHRHSRRPEKKFKLHRFLALAPNGEGQKANPLIISNVVQTNTDTWASMRKGLKSEGGNKTRSKSEDKYPQRRISSERPLKSQYCTIEKEKSSISVHILNDMTDEKINGRQVSEIDRYSISKTTLMHQKSIRFQRMTSKDETCNSEERKTSLNGNDIGDRKLSLNSASTIRLPSVHDFVDEDEDDTVNNSSKSDVECSSLTQEILSDLEQKRETSVSRVSTESSKSSIFMPKLSSSPRKINGPKQKQTLHVNLPKEEEETKEIRLSLRQEKDLTARRSYMHDMLSSRSTEQNSVIFNQTNVQISTAIGDSYHDRGSIKVSAVSMQTNPSNNSRSSSVDYQMTSNIIGANSVS